MVNSRAEFGGFYKKLARRVVRSENKKNQTSNRYIMQRAFQVPGD